MDSDDSEQVGEKQTQDSPEEKRKVKGKSY
jgi:hypothetical protein